MKIIKFLITQCKSIANHRILVYLSNWGGIQGRATCEVLGGAGSCGDGSHSRNRRPRRLQRRGPTHWNRNGRLFDDFELHLLWNGQKWSVFRFCTTSLVQQFLRTQNASRDALITMQPLKPAILRSRSQNWPKFQENHDFTKKSSIMTKKKPPEATFPAQSTPGMFR